MRTSQRIRIVSVLLLTAGLAGAQTPAAPDPAAAQRLQKLEAMGAARARLVQAFQAIPPLLDRGATSFDAKRTEIDALYTKALQVLDAALAKEQAKPEAERNASRIQTLTTERQDTYERYNVAYYKDKQVLEARLIRCNSMYVDSFVPLYNTGIACDAYWTRLEIDPDGLRGLYDTMEKRGKELVVQIQAVHAELDKQLAAWRDKLKQAQTWAGATP